MGRSISTKTMEERIAIADKVESLVFDAFANWEEITLNNTRAADLSSVVRPETKTFNILINAIGRSSYLDSAARAEDVLRTMFDLEKSRNYTHIAPDSYTYTAVMSAWSRYANRSNRKAKEAATRVAALLSEMESLFEQGNKAVKPSEFTFNTALDVLSKTGSTKDADRGEQLLERMQKLCEEGKNLDARPSTISYNACLKAWARCASRGVADAPDRAEALLQKMADRGIEPDRITYTTLIDCLAKAAPNRPGAAERAEEILRSMTHIAAIEEKGNVRPDFWTYSAVIQAWARAPNSDAATRAKSLLLQMEALRMTESDPDINIAPNTITYNTVLSAIARSGQPDAVQQAWDLLKKMEQLSKQQDRDVNVDTVTYSSIIDAMAKSNSDPEEAENLFFRIENEYQATGNELCRPNSVTLSSVVNAWARSGRLDAASRTLALLDKAEKIDHLRPNAVVYSTLLDCLAKSRGSSSTRAAEGVLERMERLYQNGKGEARPDASAYANLINCYTKSEHPRASRRALELLEDSERQYKKGNKSMKPTLLLYSAVFQALAKTRSVKSAEKAEQLLRRKLTFRARPKMTTVAFNAVIDAWARSGASDAPEKAQAILNEMIKRFDQGDDEVKPSTRSFNAVLLAWKNSKDVNAPKRAEKVLKQMNEMHTETGDKSFKADIVTINTIIGTWANRRTKEAAEKANLFLLYAEGRQAVGDEFMKPNRITFRTCIDAWAGSCDTNSLQKALEITRRMEASPYKPDLYTLHSLMLARQNDGSSSKEKVRIPSWPMAKAGAAESQAESFLVTLLTNFEEGRADAQLIEVAYSALLRAYEGSVSGTGSAEGRAKELRREREVFRRRIEQEKTDGAERSKWNLSRKFATE